MKKLILSVLSLVVASSAFAEIPEIRAKNVTCQELNEAILNYGAVTVVTKSFLFTKRLTVSREIECGARSIKTQAIFKTSDVSECAAGLYCQAEPTVIVVVDHEPRHDRYHPRPHRPAPHRPDRPQRPDRPHRVPDHNNPGPRYNPRPDHDRPSHDRPSHDRPSRPSHDRPSHDRPSHDRPSRPSHDRPSHDRPSHDRPSHDRPSRDSGSCHGRRCSL